MEELDLYIGKLSSDTTIGSIPVENSRNNGDESENIESLKMESGESVCLGNVIEVGEEVYYRVASSLVEAIGESFYFNGTIDTDCCGFYSTLTATVIVYRDGSRPDGGVPSQIKDLVPVWWEFSTVMPGGGEVLNDFSFRDLRDAVLSLE